MRFREGYPPPEGWGFHLREGEGGMRKKVTGRKPSWKDKVERQRILWAQMFETSGL